ncbi:MAG: class I SAM-dependent methyltransferase [Deltaproteobacteria bacterium]|nr:class I SAM-dependent methyltransferase [Deltaproteobacteria bacterium]
MSLKLNLNFYKGEDCYSDGDVENEILEIVRSRKNIAEVLVNDNRWPILYHLSPVRQNIINWYPFNKNSNLLEVGGGCGAITGALCNLLHEVKVVELSKRRSQINFERHIHFDNLEIIVGNLNDIIFESKFDYVMLNGVLEYAGSFTASKAPYKDFLKNVKNYLRPGGKLILAIENRYGLKYFAGAKEDHTAKEFDGITGYIGNSNVRTFGKIELEKLLNESGFSALEFYYPHPDYKMPMEIFSEYWLPKADAIFSHSTNFDFDRYDLFDESVAFQGLIENGQYEFFANSFLVICGD